MRDLALAVALLLIICAMVLAASPANVSEPVHLNFPLKTSH